MPKNNTPTEHAEQVTLFQWAAYAACKYPELEKMFAIPNGGYRHYKTAADLKSEGVKSGVPDIMLPAPKGKYHGLFVEMKRIKGGKVSDQQAGFIEYLKEQGYKVEICHGFEEAQKAIINYLKEDKNENCKVKENV